MDFLSVLSKGSQRDKVRDLCVVRRRDLLYKVARQIGVVLAEKGESFIRGIPWICCYLLKTTKETCK